MRSFGSRRPWPPEPGQELGGLLGEAYWAGLRRGEVKRLDLVALLVEMQAWVQDSRPYHQRHELGWRSAAADTHRLLSTRGPRLTVGTPALTALAGELAIGGLGANTERRTKVASLLAAGRGELGQTDAMVDAFDDLADAVTATDSSPAQLDTLVDAFSCAVREAGRSFSGECSIIARVVDDDLLEVSLARHQLDGAPVENAREDLDVDAGLSWADRLDLCRRWLRRTPTAAHHVVWLGYDRARCFWKVELGPVTFYDGSELMGLMQRASGEDADERAALSLPPELRPGTRLADPDTRELDWPKELQEWVAVRVDLGSGVFTDPVRSAREQSEALVQLAGFEAGGTSWEPFGSYKVIVDGNVHAQSHPFGPRREPRVLSDRTGEALEDLAERMDPHLPSTDPHLGDLIAASAIVQSSRANNDPAGLLADVRAVESVAARCGAKPWQKHLFDCYAIYWARMHVLDEIFNAVEQAVNDFDLRQHVQLPEDRLRDYSSDHRGRHLFRARDDLALAWLPELARDLPFHHARARQVREVARRTATVTELTAWVDELVAEFKADVQRLARCRNSMSHGGPLNLDVARSAAPFANVSARHTVALALWGAMDGRGVSPEHAELQAREDSWLRQLPSCGSVTEALTDPDTTR